MEIRTGACLHSEAQTLAQRLRRLALELALAEETLAELVDASALDVRNSRRIAYECRRFVARLDDVFDTTETAQSPQSACITKRGHSSPM